MKRPKDFNRVCDLAFLVATAVYLLMAVVGYLMFGNTVSDEVIHRLTSAASSERSLTGSRLYPYHRARSLAIS